MQAIDDDEKAEVDVEKEVEKGQIEFEVFKKILGEENKDENENEKPPVALIAEKKSQPKAKGSSGKNQSKSQPKSKGKTSLTDGKIDPSLSAALSGKQLDRDGLTQLEKLIRGRKKELFASLNQEEKKRIQKEKRSRSKAKKQEKKENRKAKSKARREDKSRKREEKKGQPVDLGKLMSKSYSGWKEKREALTTVSSAMDPDLSRYLARVSLSYKAARELWIELVAVLKAMSATNYNHKYFVDLSTGMGILESILLGGSRPTFSDVYKLRLREAKIGQAEAKILSIVGSERGPDHVVTPDTPLSHFKGNDKWMFYHLNTRSGRTNEETVDYVKWMTSQRVETGKMLIITIPLSRAKRFRRYSFATVDIVRALLSVSNPNGIITVKPDRTVVRLYSVYTKDSSSISQTAAKIAKDLNTAITAHHRDVDKEFNLSQENKEPKDRKSAVPRTERTFAFVGAGRTPRGPRNEKK